MYDWIRTAPTKYYDNYSYNEKKKGFGIRALPPKPSTTNNTKNFFDKNLNILGRNLSNNRVKSFSEIKSRSSNKSLTRLLVTQDDVYPKPKPVPKQRNLNNSATHHLENSVTKANESNATYDNLAVKKKAVNYENIEGDDYDEYDNFKYMDQYYMPMDDIYDNHNNTTTNNDTTIYDKENYFETTNGKEKFLINISFSKFYALL